MELGLKTGVKAPDWAKDRGRHSEEPPQGLVMQPYEPWELGLDLVSSVATPSIRCLHTALWGGRPWEDLWAMPGSACVALLQ